MDLHRKKDRWRYHQHVKLNKESESGQYFHIKDTSKSSNWQAKSYLAY